MTNDWQENYIPKRDARPESEDNAPSGCAGCPAAGSCGTDHESSSCHSCPAKHAAEAVEQARRDQRLQDAVRDIDHEILVLSGKGGVGKSTVAANLAWAFALDARQPYVGLLDADLHGPTVPLMMGLRGERAQVNGDRVLPIPIMSTLKVMSMGFLLEDPDTPIIWRGAIRANAIHQLVSEVDWGHLDYLVVDLPPGTGDEALAVTQAFPRADGAIIVTTPQEASLEDCRKAINFVREVHLPVLGVIENMSGFICPHCGERTDIFKRGGGEQMAREMGVDFLGSVPLVPEVVMLGDEGQPLVGSQAPAPIREAFAAIAAKVLEAIHV